VGSGSSLRPGTGSGTYADLAVLSNGQIWQIQPTGLIGPGQPAVFNRQFVSLEGISYQN
jgi:hypothetical protein